MSTEKTHSVIPATLNVGFGNFIMTDKILGIFQTDSRPIQSQIQIAKQENRVVDATKGKQTKSVILTIQGTYILSAITTDSLRGRLQHL